MALSKPGARLAVASGSLALTVMAVRKNDVSRTEEGVFRAVNNLRVLSFPPVWLVMQCGNAGAIPVAACAALAWGDRQLAARLLVAGSTTWALSKAVKRGVHRARPAALLPATHRRGAEPAGSGYLSGHAAVTAALGAAALPQLGRAPRAGVLVLVPAVGLARVYVGAHLPLDIAGGAALGLGVEAVVSLLSRSRACSAGRGGFNARR